MLKLRSTLIAVLLMMFTVTACGDDGPTGTNSGDAMTEDEIQEVLLALFGAFNALGGPAAAGPAAVSVDLGFDDQPECELDGFVDVTGDVTGEIDDVTGDTDFTYSLNLDPQGCEVPTANGSITLDGDPSLQFDLDWISTETTLSLDGAYSGGVAFSADDGRSGSCAFDVTFIADVNFQGGGSSSANGTICGISASGLNTFVF